MIYTVDVTVSREVRAATATEAERIARALVPVMPHIDPAVCPSPASVTTSVDAAALERGDSDALCCGAPHPEGAPLCSRPAGHPGLHRNTDANRLSEWMTTNTVRVVERNAAGEVCAETYVIQDVDEPHPDLVDLPPAPAGYITDRARAIHRE